MAPENSPIPFHRSHPDSCLPVPASLSRREKRRVHTTCSGEKQPRGGLREPTAQITPTACSWTPVRVGKTIHIFYFHLPVRFVLQNQRSKTPSLHRSEFRVSSSFFFSHETFPNLIMFLICFID